MLYFRLNKNIKTRSLFINAHEYNFKEIKSNDEYNNFQRNIQNETATIQKMGECLFKDQLNGDFLDNNFDEQTYLQTSNFSLVAKNQCNFRLIVRLGNEDIGPDTSCISELIQLLNKINHDVTLIQKHI